MLRRTKSSAGASRVSVTTNASGYSIRSFVSNISRRIRKDPNPTLPTFLTQRLLPHQQLSNYRILSRDEVSIPELTVDDVIIVVMGPTGVGKSNFIYTLTENESIVGHGPETYTRGVFAYRLRCSDGIDIVLVDTPAFDSTHSSDLRILEVIAKWLKEVGRRGLQVSAFLYLHCINHHMESSSQKSLKIFQKIAGKQFFSRVTLMTTMWPDPADTVEMEESETIERELREEYWAMMIQKGSKVARFTNTRESARRIIDGIIIAESKMQWCRIQQELVDQGKTLSATDAGKEVFYAYYEDMVARQNVLMQQLGAEMEKAAADPVKITALQQQLRDELVKWKNARKEMRKLEPSGKKGWRHNLKKLFH